uniref:Serine/threonine protein phosphatase 7 long form isogeny n=1 Tax=Cajanus cajan TaxID=3821 RepID=A0A151TDJ5_CAJCA|nr:Serine/threonine protein phosphatase 7 long form isogeny [Cajanus cajan]
MLKVHLFVYVPLEKIRCLHALIKCWRLETHTFHMSFGKCTITLEDVAILLGLKVSSLPITGYTTMDWVGLVERIWGITPPNQQQLECYTKAFILRIIDGYLLTYHSSSFVYLRYLAMLKDFDDYGRMS